MSCVFCRSCLGIFLSVMFVCVDIHHLNIFHQQMAAQLKDLAGKLRGIGGVQSLDFGKKKGGSVSGSGARDVQSSRPVNPSEQVVNETISVV